MGRHPPTPTSPAVGQSHASLYELTLEKLTANKDNNHQPGGEWRGTGCIACMQIETDKGVSGPAGRVHKLSTVAKHLNVSPVLITYQE